MTEAFGAACDAVGEMGVDVITTDVPVEAAVAGSFSEDSYIVTDGDGDDRIV
jgi:hypothetical protein